MKPSRADVVVAGARIAGARWNEGAGRPLVLLHSLALSHAMWTPSIARLFGSGHELVALDLPGHGGSPLGQTRTIEQMAERVDAALDDLGVAEPVVVGVSMGGAVAQALATRRRGPLRGLGLVDTTSGYGDSAAWRERAEKARASGLDSLARFQADRWFGDGFRDTHPEEVERVLGLFRRMDLDAYEHVCAAMGAFDLWGAIATIDCPTHVVVGANDYATPPQHARRLAATIPGAGLTVLEGHRHLAILESPEEVHAALAPIL